MKKSLPIGMIVVILLLALAATGIAYGYWTDQVKINGAVQTGELDVEWAYYANSDTNCTYSMDPTYHTFTITGANAAPSDVLDYAASTFWCEVFLQVKNTGTIPVKLQAPIITKTGPDYWTIWPPVPGVETVQPGEMSTGYYNITFRVPASETGNEGATSTLAVVVNAVQVNAP